MRTDAHVCACVLFVLLPLTSTAANRGDETTRHHTLTSHLDGDGDAVATSEGSVATVIPPVWTKDITLNEVLTAVVDGYADVVDPERVAEDMRWMNELLGRWHRSIDEVCPRSEHTVVPSSASASSSSSEGVSTRPIAPLGTLADAVHSAYLGRQRALKARLSPKGPRSLRLRDVDNIGRLWVHRLFRQVLATTPQADATWGVGRLGFTAMQLTVAYMDHIALDALLRRGVGCAVGKSGQPTPAELAARNCDDIASKMIRTHCTGDNDHIAGNKSERDANVATVNGSIGSAPPMRCALPFSASVVSQDSDVATPAKIDAAQAAAWEMYRASGWWTPVHAKTHTRRNSDSDSTVENPDWDPTHEDPPDLPRCSRVLPTVMASDLTAKGWLHRLSSAAAPLVILNATLSWRLMASMHKDSLSAPPLRDIDLMTSSIPYGEHYDFESGLASFGEMLSYLDTRRTGSDDIRQTVPLYAFDGETLERLFGGEYPMPDAINSSFRGWPVQAHQLALGPAGSGSPLHFHEDAVNALIYGVKRWDLLPPSKTLFSIEAPWCPPSSAGAPDMHAGHASNTSSVDRHGDSGSVDQRGSNYARHGSGRRDGESGGSDAVGGVCGAPPDGGVRCVQLPGDLVYVPRRWAHSTFNLVEGVAIAVESDGSACVRGGCAHVVV